MCAESFISLLVSKGAWVDLRQDAINISLLPEQQPELFFEEYKTF